MGFAATSCDRRPRQEGSPATALSRLLPAASPSVEAASTASCPHLRVILCSLRRTPRCTTHRTSDPVRSAARPDPSCGPQLGAAFSRMSSSPDNSEATLASDDDMSYLHGNVVHHVVDHHQHCENTALKERFLKPATFWCAVADDGARWVWRTRGQLVQPSPTIDPIVGTRRRCRTQQSIFFEGGRGARIIAPYLLLVALFSDHNVLQET
jgi:hypothetical protein